MQRNIIKGLFIFTMCSMVAICGCGGGNGTSGNNQEGTGDGSSNIASEADEVSETSNDYPEDVESSEMTEAEEKIEEETEIETEATQKEETENSELKQTMGIQEFDELLAQLPLKITSTNYVVQSDEYKTLYPDMLQSIIQNDSGSDIKDAVIAYAAWDENNLPVKIKGSIDYSDGSYIKKVNCADINLEAGGTYGDSAGFEIDTSCGIKSFKAIIVSFDTFEGDEWTNPYYDEWCKMYEGVKYNDELTTEVQLEDAEFKPAQLETEAGEIEEVDETEEVGPIENQ